jgi:phospholipase C
MTARIDRRTLLQAALAVGGAGMLAAAGGPGGAGAAVIRKASSTPAAGSDLGAIEHVVFLMQENRSFDHYFGTYPGVRGFDDRPAGRLGAFSQAWPGGRDPHLLPFHLDSASGMGECTFDLDHSWKGQHLCRGPHHDNSAFVATHTSSAYEGPVHGTLTMGYYRRNDLPFYYALADAFTICDNYHCSVFGPTHPNRLMSMSGTLDPSGRKGGPVLTSNPSPDVIYSASWDTMPEVLEDAGISWKVYTPAGSLYAPPFFVQHGLLAGNAILPYFKQYRDPSSALYQKAFLPQYPADFVSDIANGTLPAVSWLLQPIGYDEHPPSPSALGEWFTAQVLSALTSNPAVWSRTVLFHMYDENDGWFDHVAPPAPPPGTAGEYLTGRGAASALGERGVRGPVGLGYRVPMLVLSPFSRGGHVASQVFDHTSQLRFVESRFGVRAPNISAWRRSATGDLTSALHMHHRDTSVPSLPSTAGDTQAAVMALGCSGADIVGATTNKAPYPVPAHQSMPRQERR